MYFLNVILFFNGIFKKQISIVEEEEAEVEEEEGAEVGGEHPAAKHEDVRSLWTIPRAPLPQT